MGPSIGGVRMATDVTTEECARLARAMTLKNSAAGLPHGGGKAVIVGDPKMPRAEKENLIRGVADYANGEKLDGDAIIDIDCDIWTPAARPDVIREDSVHRRKARSLTRIYSKKPFTSSPFQPAAIS